MVARHISEQQQLKRAGDRPTWYSADVVSALNILIFFPIPGVGIEKAHANVLSREFFFSFLLHAAWVWCRTLYVQPYFGSKFCPMVIHAVHIDPYPKVRYANRRSPRLSL